MSERILALSLGILGVIAVVAVWRGADIIAAATEDAQAQAGLVLIAIGSSVVTGICGFMVGRSFASGGGRVGPPPEAPQEDQ